MSFNAPDIRQFKLTGSTVGDVYFPQTSVLLPFNGSNGATSTSDLSNRNGTVAFNGTAQISTAQSKFGESSLILDGDSDYVTVLNSYWNSCMNSGDFTVELWVRWDSAALDGSTNTELITNRGDSGGGTANGWSIRKYTDNKVSWYMRIGSGWVYLNYAQGTRTAVSADTWYHVAVTRSGNTWKLFLNGTAEDTITNSSSITSGAASGLYLGVLAGGISASAYMDGYIDDVRVTVGHARYTSNFTPPTATHLTSAGDANKQIIVNSSADGVDVGTGGINQARIAKAWLNYDGTTPSIRDSYNIGSVTDNGTGQYTVNYSAAMTDANYSIVAFAHDDQTGSGWWRTAVSQDGASQLAGSFAVETIHSSGDNYVDSDTVCIQVFGN